MVQEIFKELVEGREKPAIRLEPVTELTLEELGGVDPTLEYIIDDDDYYYFDEYNMVDQDDRLAAINYQVMMRYVCIVHCTSKDQFEETNIVKCQRSTIQ